MVEIDRADARMLGQRLTEARRARGVTQEAAAAHLGCSRPTLIAIEKGTRPAKPEEIVALAELYGRTLHELVRPGAGVSALEPHLRAAVDSSQTGGEELAEAIREFQRFAEDYCELERLTGTSELGAYTPEVSIPARADLRHFAEHVGVRERSRLQLGDQPILNLRQVMENDGGLRVFYGPMPSSVAGMYAFAADLGYCVFINRKHPPERQRYTLAHEYGHFLCDRHKPGIDYLSGSGRKPKSERFADAFAMSFLMPESAIRRQVTKVTAATGDFQVADLCRLSNYYFVSVQAMTLRLEDLGLIENGTWDYLKEEGFQPALAKQELGLEPPGRPEEAYPQRYKYLAVQALSHGTISEGQLARFLRSDRVTAREVVAQCSTRPYDDPDGNPVVLQMPFDQSVLKGKP
jgi:Zn-dependent peptidase ImmA (M78 family)/transcriptional regulator with XRE-family HTH domain